MTRRLLNPQPVRVNSLTSPRRQKAGDLFIAPDLFPTSEKCGLVLALAESRGVTRCLGSQNFCEEFAKYKVGEIVGIAEPWFAQRRFNHLSGKKLAERRYKYEDFALHYLADGPKPWGFGRYRQARFLPDAFVRTKVRILEVRVERLQDISEEDAKAEGVVPLPSAHIAATVAGDTPHRMEFYALWESIHGKGAWESNEWVFVYRLELVSAGKVKPRALVRLEDCESGDVAEAAQGSSTGSQCPAETFTPPANE